MKREPASETGCVMRIFAQIKLSNSLFLYVQQLKKLILLVCIFFTWQDSQAQEVDDDVPADTVEVVTKKYKPKISGFIQTQFLQHIDTNNDQETKPSRFRMQRVRVKVEGKISKRISYQVEIDPRPPQITGFLRDAYISLHFIKKHEIRIGQQKTRFGYENSIGSSNLFFVNRTDVSDNLSRGINLRDIGIGLMGSVKLNERWRIEDAVTVVNGAGMNVQADNNHKKSIWGRVGIRYKTDYTKWKFGISGAKADVMETAIDSLGEPFDYFIYFTRLGADVQFEKKWFSIAGEYIIGNNDEPDGPSDVSGYYFMLAGKTPIHIGPTLRYEDMDGEFKRWTIGAYYGEPSARLRILANYEIRQVDDPEMPLGEDNRFYLWLMVRF
jgi:hypothetical protein